jgi:hypothetical protein
LTAIEPFGGNRARSEATQRTPAATARRNASLSDDLTKISGRCTAKMRLSKN